MTDTRNDLMKNESLIRDDVKCSLCKKWKFRYQPRCTCGKKGGGSDKESVESTSAPATLTPSETKSLRRDDENSIAQSENFYEKKNKWSEFGLRLKMSKTSEIYELLKLLVLQINPNDGSLTFEPQPGLSQAQLDELKQLLKDIQNGNGLEAFKNYLKNEKGISLDGYDIELNIQNGNRLVLTIPNKTQREKFIQQLINKNLLPPTPEKTEQKEEHQFTTPFRMTPVKNKLVR